MAKAKAICICRVCGEQFTTEKICANRRDADNWQAWAENHFDECPECYKARKQQELSDRIASAGYAPFTKGSEKQKAWAEKIRYNLLSRLEQKKDELSDAGRECYQTLINESDARFWIDNRDRSIMEIFRDWAKSRA